MTETHTNALRLLGHGFSVIPVPRPRAGVPAGAPGDGKVPTIKWREFQERRPTEAELAAWCGVPMNLAVVTGAISGVVVVDADTPEALRWCTRRLKYTPWQVQTPRGFHLYYQHPGGVIPNRARLQTDEGKLAIDLRADGGYVIAAGSIHASGGTYREAGDWTAPRADVPIFWRGWLQRATRPVPTLPAAPRATGDLVTRAQRYLGAIDRPEIGQGSDAAVLYAACRLVRGFGVSASDAESLLWQWAGGRSGWTREWIAEKVAHAERYGTEPVGALR